MYRSGTEYRHRRDIESRVSRRSIITRSASEKVHRLQLDFCLLQLAGFDIRIVPAHVPEAPPPPPQDPRMVADRRTQTENKHPGPDIKFTKRFFLIIFAKATAHHAALQVIWIHQEERKGQLCL